MLSSYHPAKSSNADSPTDEGLWGQIMFWMDKNEKMTFAKYLSKRRIDYVMTILEEDLGADIHELFNYVGYRQRSTAWRNFQKVTGTTPAEFLESLR